MEFTIQQTDFAQALAVVSKAVAAKPQQPLLGCIKVTATSEGVTLTAFDLRLGIRQLLKTQVKQTGEVALPARLLKNVVMCQPKGEITFHCDSSDPEVVSLTSISGRYQLKTITAAEFPAIPEVESKLGIALILDSLVLQQGLFHTLFAAATEETKMLLTGIHLTVTEKAIEFAATDGHRLSVKRVSRNSANKKPKGEDIKVTIPATALKELGQILKGSSLTTPVALSLSNSWVGFDLETVQLTCRTLEGDYPAYPQLIPNDFQHRCTCDTKVLVQAVSRLAQIKAGESQVRLMFDYQNQQMNLSVKTEAGNGVESIAAKITGKSPDMGFNLDYLKEVLKVFETPEILLQFNQPNQPMILSPVQGGKESLVLVMPNLLPQVATKAEMTVAA